MWGEHVKKKLFEWLDVLLLSIGMALISVGAFQIYIPAGFIVLGLCCVALAFFVAKKQARR
ncbi:MAG: hypothetical protein WCT05_14380 [Lentisphaeria bacterium]